jgi:hypothetical protein
MLITGGSKYNEHKGDTYIRNGSLAVEGNIQVGTTSSGTYYELPNQAGNVDDVLTLVSANSAEWKAPTAGFTGKIAKTQYVMQQPRNTGFTPFPATIDLTGTGSKTINLSQLPIGSSLHIVARGRVANSVGVGSVLGGWRLIINVGLPSVYSYQYSQYGITPATPNTGTASFFELEYLLTRTADEDYYISGWGATSNGGTISGFDSTRQDFTFTPTSFTQNFGTSITFDITFDDFSTGGAFMNSNAKVYYAETFVDVQALVGETTTNDHLLLTNLNGGTDGDAGHTNMTLLSGRTGGQTIIGGTQAGDNLELKSNSTTPLVDHVLLGSALDTKFHRIFSSNPATPLVIEHDSVLDSIRLKISGADKFDVNQNENKHFQNVNLNSNSIYEVFELRGNNNLFLQAFDGTGLIIENAGNIILQKDLNVNTYRLTNVGDIIFNKLSGAQKLIENNDPNPSDLVIGNNSGGGAILLNHSGINHIEINGNPETFFRNAPVEFEASVGAVYFRMNGLSSTIDNSSTIFQTDSDFTIESPDISLGSATAQGIFMGATATDPVEIYRPMDMKNNNITNVSTINGIQPSGGLSAGLTDSATLTASTAEQSILPLTFVGNRQVPPNTFQTGDSFSAVLAGSFGSNNGDTLTIRLKGGATATTILSTIVIPLNASSGAYFEAEIDFTIRATGVAGVANLASNFDFTYNQSAGGNFQGERLVAVNSTTFDTTILNQLEITAQFSSANAANTITTILSTLTKTY